jgi:hypothetical protein
MRGATGLIAVTAIAFLAVAPLQAAEHAEPATSVENLGVAGEIAAGEAD